MPPYTISTTPSIELPWLPYIPLSRLIHIIVKHRTLWVIIRKTISESLQKITELYLFLIPYQDPSITPNKAEQQQTLNVDLAEDFCCFCIALYRVQHIGNSTKEKEITAHRLQTITAGKPLAHESEEEIKHLHWEERRDKPDKSQGVQLHCTSYFAWIKRIVHHHCSHCMFHKFKLPILLVTYSCGINYINSVLIIIQLGWLPHFLCSCAGPPWVTVLNVRIPPWVTVLNVRMLV